MPLPRSISDGRGPIPAGQSQLSDADVAKLKGDINGGRIRLQANLLTLTAPELTVLIGGLRVLGTNYDNSSHGVLTDRVGTLTNDFFTNLLDMDITWTATDDTSDTFEARDGSGAVKWTSTRPEVVLRLRRFDAARSRR